MASGVSVSTKVYVRGEVEVRAYLHPAREMRVGSCRPWRATALLNVAMGDDFDLWGPPEVPVAALREVLRQAAEAVRTANEDRVAERLDPERGE